MIKDNRRQKLRLLTEWMDYFILENKQEIERSMNEEGIVFICNKLEKEEYDIAFGLMIFTNYEMNLSVKVTINAGADKGQSIWIEIQKQDNKSIVLFSDNREFGKVLTYQLDLLMGYMSHQSLADLIESIKEIKTNKEACQVCEIEVEAFIQESIINYYLDKGEFEPLKQILSKEVKQTGGIPNEEDSI